VSDNGIRPEEFDSRQRQIRVANLTYWDDLAPVIVVKFRGFAWKFIGICQSQMSYAPLAAYARCRSRPDRLLRRHGRRTECGPKAWRFSITVGRAGGSEEHVAARRLTTAVRRDGRSRSRAELAALAGVGGDEGRRLSVGWKKFRTLHEHLAGPIDQWKSSGGPPWRITSAWLRSMG
jgi:hypothetical protein